MHACYHKESFEYATDTSWVSYVNRQYIAYLPQHKNEQADTPMIPVCDVIEKYLRDKDPV